ncbi:FAD binding domain-containing protein [Sarocladium implicatum]|nr:FAD binding domain-containing protein [Sarocladium implicatum]
MSTRNPLIGWLKCLLDREHTSKKNKKRGTRSRQHHDSSDSETIVSSLNGPDTIPYDKLSSNPDTHTKKPSIAIIGGGISGLALAIALTKRKVPCTVYEASASLAAVGAGIGLGSNSLAALDMIDPRLRGLYDLAKTGNENPAFRKCVFDALLAEPGLGLWRDPAWMEGIVGAPYFERSSAHRNDLLNILESFVPEGTIKFSKRLSTTKQLENGKVQATFDDGERVEVDAVVGCDGINGRTRKAVLENIAPDAILPTYCNMYIYRGIIPMPDAKAILGTHGGDSKRFLGKRRGVVVYPIARGCDANLMFYVRHDDPWTHGSKTTRCTRKEMQEEFDGLDSRLLKLLEAVEPVRWPVYHHKATPKFYNGRTCILGDAAHATSPHLAAGAGQGLEDVVILANLLALVQDPNQIETAFEVYDQVRRPRASSVVEDSERAGLMYCFEGPEGDDMGMIVKEANVLFRRVWEHDLAGDAVKAEKLFLELTALRTTSISTK